MKRLNAIQSQNLSFLKFFIVALLFVFLAKMGEGLFKSKHNELSKNTPPALQSAVSIWKG